ncbi:uncharacterized protein PGTG_20609 [Puccinia graminis f. sp. tritici CRL 75-36-700-3]|uniref:Uncharacterized protein n=1 Tax=Puccinia graminis f. sp. tritici (strain CRL 75-36-700-3 / race SCCL) TaxID=418459 RepID=H6QNU4_PUCGT|nr:uncharacterized protein PGTG_20609 [Puccinia graminis f. sp. tritici CRL 75-36-700-3]EHS62486.1 hypothetical protein PGTG_20609 [Puccinia graminis f. sp. tritici CRL 75-36-700-3]
MSWTDLLRSPYKVMASRKWSATPAKERDAGWWGQRARFHPVGQALSTPAVCLGSNKVLPTANWGTRVVRPGLPCNTSPPTQSPSSIWRVAFRNYPGARDGARESSRGTNPGNSGSAPKPRGCYNFFFLDQ